MLIKTRVKYIQSLSHKKFRDEEGVFIAEGPKIINELLKAPNLELQELFATAPWLEENSPPAGPGVITVVSEKELERLSGLATPNQVLGIFSKPHFEDPVRPEDRITLLLDTIQDPGNMGTIVRTADWFGIDQLICSPECADIFNPKVVQSTMGSICRVQVYYTDPAVILEKTAVPVYAAALRGADIYTLPPIEEGIIMIGNESRGLSEKLLARSQYPVTIPRKGAAESLNASVAAGILLAHFTRPA